MHCLPGTKSPLNFSPHLILGKIVEVVVVVVEVTAVNELKLIKHFIRKYSAMKASDWGGLVLIPEPLLKILKIYIEKSIFEKEVFIILQVIFKNINFWFYLKKDKQKKAVVVVVVVVNAVNELKLIKHYIRKYSDMTNF